MKKKIVILMLLFLFVCGCSKDTSKGVINKVKYEETNKITNYVKMDTTKGIILIELYPEIAPITVENFQNLINEKFYDGLIFHRVIKDFMIQGGDPTGTGCGGESIWGRSFEDEFSLDARNYYGALSMANSGPNTNGSQFFIVQAKEVPDNLLSQMKQLGSNGGFPDDVIQVYEQKGGTPWLDFHHTVFGMITSGEEVLEDIASTRTGMGDKPVYDVVIETINIED